MIPIIILAGGLATRLRPITETIPKSLVEINGRPFVLHQIDLLIESGITKLHFCLGYLGEKIKTIVSEYTSEKKIEISFSYDGEILLGTGGAIKKALQYVSEPFFITYGDSYLEIDYKLMLKQYDLNKDKYSGMMAVYKNIEIFDVSNVSFENGNLHYSKKNPTDNMHYIDYGVGILKYKPFETYALDQSFDLSELYENLSKNNLLKAFEVTNRFYEIGSFNGINDISQYLKNKI